MVPQNQSLNAKNIKIVLFSMIASGFVYAGVLLILNSSKEIVAVSDTWPQVKFIYFLFLIPFVVLTAFLVERNLWVVFKKNINSEDSFNQVFLNISLITYAILEVIDILSIIIYIFSRNLVFSLLLLGVSLLIKLIYYPNRLKLEEKKKAFLNL